ncbi:hypothetical protein [Corynebacterium aquatimens]|uniref:hypothetical protein n=1 Tax=Corynebacterium aquatimens TaxID=1190508 RepID=UPI0025402A83|nr:hypothetical protein [Corynebacterium aquatimens]
MTFIELSHRTAPTALASLPDTSPLPVARLSSSQAAAALATAQSREHVLIDASLSALTSHLTAIADFARAVERADSFLSNALDTGLSAEGGAVRSAVGKAGAAGAVGAAGAAGAVAYTPHLNPAELREAAAALDIAQRDVEARAAAARRAARDLAGTGFAGPAAANALSRTTELAGALDARAASMARMRMVLEAAAAAQQMLDLAAATALRYGHYRTVLWLNQLSLQLDTELARELNRARGAGFQPLANSPGEDLHALSARHMATLPAATRGHVEAVGGLVLEAGPASTTVMVGDAVDPARIITMVAGATTGHPDQLAHELEKAQLIAQRTGATVVVWQGYQPPKELGRALSPASASEGSGNLALFQAALEERFPARRRRWSRTPTARAWPRKLRRSTVCLPTISGSSAAPESPVGPSRT